MVEITKRHNGYLKEFERTYLALRNYDQCCGDSGV